MKPDTSITTDGFLLIAITESCQLQEYIPPEGGENRAIGFGRTYRGSKYPNGITYAQALLWLDEDIKERAELLAPYVKTPLTPDQWSAIVSLAYNLGASRIGKSNTCACLNCGDIERMGKEWREFRLCNGEVAGGLVTRREAEITMFHGGDWKKVLREGGFIV